MSRSRKKVAGFVDRNPEVKRKFNRSVRRKFNQAKLLYEKGEWVEHISGVVEECMEHETYMSFDIANGKTYKKLNCSWDICDYASLYFTKREFDKWHTEEKGTRWYTPWHHATMK